MLVTDCWGCRVRSFMSPRPTKAAKKLRFIDLFCGIGGFRYGFERAGAECVFSSDWDKFSQITYEANHGEKPHGDIRSIAVEDIRLNDFFLWKVRKKSTAVHKEAPSDSFLRRSSNSQ